MTDRKGIAEARHHDDVSVCKDGRIYIEIIPNAVVYISAYRLSGLSSVLQIDPSQKRGAVPGFGIRCKRSRDDIEFPADHRGIRHF